MDGNLRATVAGFAASLVVLAVLLWVVGIGSIVDAVSMADPPTLALVAGAAALWIVSWAMSLRTVLGVLGSPVGVGSSVLIYTAAVFANNVTPFGQAGGEPISAYLISEVTGNDYENGLAAIASVDALNLVPSLSLAAIAIGYFTATAALGQQLLLAAVVVGALLVLIPAAGYAVWRGRERVEALLASAVTPLVGLLARPVPGRDPPARAEVLARVEGFFGALERVATSRRRVLLAVGFATLGWLGLSSSLWLSLLALGYQVPFAAAILVVPLGAIAGVTPLPGGLGGIETVLIALIVPVTSVTPVAAGAAVLIHRIATYWLPTLVGGGIAALIGAEGFTTGPEPGD
jgi:hypothetical protein